MIATSQFRMCDVCRLLDYDTADKECFYCPMCDAWICQPCSGNWIRRIKAAVKRKLEPGYRGQEDYVEVIQKQMNEAKKQENKSERTRPSN